MSQQAASHVPVCSDAPVEYLLITEHQGFGDLFLLKRLWESELKFSIIRDSPLPTDTCSVGWVKKTPALRELKAGQLDKVFRTYDSKNQFRIVTETAC